MKTKEFFHPVNFLKIAFLRFHAFLFLFLLTSSLRAGEELYPGQLKGNQVTKNNTLNVKDILFRTGPSPDEWITFNKIRYQRAINRIVLKVDTSVYSPVHYTCTVNLEVKFKDKDNKNKTYMPALTVEFRNGGNPTEADQFVYQFFGGHDVTIKIMSILVNSVEAAAPPNLILENNILINRFYEFNGSDYPGDLSVLPKNSGSELEIKWPPVTGAEEFQLEWMYVNDYNGDEVTGSLPTSDVTIDFNTNATRVSLPASVLSYTINNVYEKGYVVFRHRAIGRIGAGNKIPVEGRWCAPDKGRLSDYSSLEYYRVLAHQSDKMNWFYTAAFAEEGKKKENVSYMDGTNKNRQSVSKLNTENQTIVSETIYDKEGRPAVSMLPSPSGVSALTYNKNYNRNSAGKDYSSPDFESNTSPCVNQASPLQPGSGAANYFSPSNPNKNGMQAYLPDAGGFPFSQIEYTTDNTGRIKRQGGVGKDHQLNSGHEVTNYYGKPIQEHLDRLFGSEAGYCGHYKKNMVRDANGQLGVTYLDMFGRTIATALAGAHPENLEAVYSDGMLKTTTVNVLDNQPLIKGDRSIRSQFVYLANSTGKHEFRYEVFAPFYKDESCITDANICFDCIYDLEISVKDICGAELIPGGPIKKTVGKITDFMCGKPEVDSIEKFEFTIDKTGTYYINKTLTVNQKALNDGMKFYIENKNCVKTYNEFVKDEFVKMDFTGCEQPLDCRETCEDKLGTESKYLADNPGKTHKDYLREMLACRMECETPPTVSSQRQTMLMDLSPGGQYADTIIDSQGRVRGKDFTSIYHAFNYLNVNILSESIVFEDENGNKDYVKLANGEWGTPNELFAESLESFIEQWKPSWAEVLFKFHPEYNYYFTMRDVHYDQPYSYQMLMMHVDTYEEALRLGLLNPICITDVPVPVPTDANSDPLHFVPASTGQPHMDPFYSNLGSTRHPQMTEYMKNYQITKNGSTIKGLWQIAASTVVCNDPDMTNPSACATACSSYVFSPINATDICTVDRVWKVFRALYLSKRQEMFDEELESSAVGMGPTNKNIGTSGIFANKQKRFPGMLSDLKLKYGNDIFGTTSGQIDNNKNMMQAEIADQCDSVCLHYADTWLPNLSGCNPSAAPWDATNSVYQELREKLIAVCKLGCDAEHSLGSSTVPPGSSGVPSNRPSIPNYKSFSDVIKGIFGSEKPECTSNLISMPVPYENDLNDFTSEGIMDTCACDKVLYVDWYYNDMVTNHVLPAGMTKVKLFKKIYKVDIDELNGKICLCKKALAKSGIPVWSPNVNWGTASVNSLLATKEPVQPSLTCEKCTNCTTVRDLVNDFKTVFEAQVGSPIPENKIGLYERNLVDYLNDSLNMDLTMLDYDTFLNECNKVLEGGYTCVPGPAAKELEKMLNLLAFDDKLKTKAFLCKSPYTPTTQLEKNKWDFSYTDLLAGKVDPTFVSSPCEHVYCFDHVEGNTLYGTIKIGTVVKCSLELTFTEPGFLFENIREFTHLYIDPKNPGSNYNFVIKATMAMEDTKGYTYLTGKTTCIPLGECSNNDNTLTLCSGQPDQEDDCVKELVADAFSNARTLYSNHINLTKNEFVTRYINKCLEAAKRETFTMKFGDGEYHYTLYYYDQAGNLVRTVPPEGVELITDKNDLEQIIEDREDRNRTVFTKHRMASTYVYNSLNQLVNQSVPDHDKLNDWLTFNQISGLPAGLPIIKAQTNKDDGTYFIATDSDPNKSVIYYTSPGSPWNQVTDFGLKNLSAVHYIGSTGYAVGDNGILLKTTDGTTWSISSTGINEDLKEIYFSTTNNGIIITRNVNIYRTTNAGTTWNLLSGTGLGLDVIYELAFGSPTNGIAVGVKGVNGAVYKTTDGGLTWTPSTSFVTNDLKTVQLVANSTIAYAAGVAGTMLVSNNAGQDWQEMNCNLTINMKEIFFANGDIGCALGEDGILYKTSSGGVRWDVAQNPNADDTFVDIQFITASTGYVVSKKGEVRITNSSGGSWTLIQTVPAAGVNMSTVFFERDYVGYVAGESGKLFQIIKESSGAYTVSSIATNITAQHFASLHFKGTSGSALLANGSIMKSADGGSVWTNASPVSTFYTSFSFTNPDIATAVSNTGKTAYTIDAGLTWVAGVDLPGSASAITTNATGNAIAVGSNGNIFSSVNYGSNWDNKSQKIKPLTLRGGFMKNSGTAYIAGDGGSFYKSTDGGANWKIVPTTTNKYLQDVGENNGNLVLCGSEGLILVSANISLPLPVWTPKNVPTAIKHNKRIAFNGVRGYINTSDGKILVSSDYGGTWMEYYAGTVPLNGLFMLTESLGYAVGEKGTIIKITPAPAVSLIKGIKPAKLNDTHCEENFAMAVGNGVILRSKDGGQTWENIVTSPSAIMRAVAFVEPSSGDSPSPIIIAGNGFVWRSTNGGDTFDPISSPAITAVTKLSAMSMITAEQIYAVGDLGVIRRSINGGLDWEIVTSPVSEDLTAITIKGKVGFITGKNGTILKSENVFGSSPGWFKLLQSPTNESWVKYLTNLNPVPTLNSVYFHDYTTGFVAGDKGVLLKTMNGGMSWEQMPVSSIEDLKYITFSSDSKGAIFGNNSTSLGVLDNNDNISTRFYYDRIGRLVASQNTKQHQMALPRYSYTRYDEQNRIIETGEAETHLKDLDKYRLNAPNFPDNLVVAKYNVTKTYYDAPLNPEIIGFFGAGGQQNLRSRIASVTIHEVYDPSKKYDHATHYSYDVHGNVKSVVQDNPELE